MDVPSLSIQINGDAMKVLLWLSYANFLKSRRQEPPQRIQNATAKLSDLTATSYEWNNPIYKGNRKIGI